MSPGITLSAAQAHNRLFIQVYQVSPRSTYHLYTDIFYSTVMLDSLLEITGEVYFIYLQVKSLTSSVEAQKSQI